MKKWFSVNELLSLDTMPNTSQAINHRARKDSWESRTKTGKGGGKEFSFESLPEATRNEIIKRSVGLQDKSPAVPALKVSARDLPKALAKSKKKEQLMLTLSTADELNANQRAIAEARCAMVAEVLMLEQAVSREKAMSMLIHMASTKELPPVTQQLAMRANARGNDERIFSRRTLCEWIKKYLSAKNFLDRLRLLAPAERTPDMTIPVWAAEFLKIYRRPERPTLAESYETFIKLWKASLHANAGYTWTACELPSIHQVRRFLKKLPAETLYHGRMSGASLKAVMPYVQRDWSLLDVNDVWIGDGHGMKMKVAHPDHGNPFKPEVTLIMDAHTRVIVGWSVSLSENVLAVCDALRHGVMSHGLPLIYYSDNGGGQKNKMFDAPVTGMLGRLGIQHETGIPGSPQGRGLIERAHGTILLKLARQFETYQGPDMDRDTLRKRANTIESQIKAVSRGERHSVEMLPSWESFIEKLEVAIREYNEEHPHSELPKRNGMYMTPAEFYQTRIKADRIHRVGQTELQDLFRPYVIRTAKRGLVQLWNNSYFSRDLMLVDGQEVQVGYDVHSAQSVVIRDLDGRFVCVAEFNGNKREGFAKTFVEQLHEKRVSGMKARAQEVIDRADAELRPLIEAQDSFVIPGLNMTRAEIDAMPAIQPQEDLTVQATVTPEEVLDERRALIQRKQALMKMTPPERMAEWIRFDGVIRNGGHVEAHDRDWYFKYRELPEWKSQYLKNEDQPVVRLVD
ncbi:Mu transposase C-terminal domain-containing protein [Leeia sp. TBRC 13508]|uniref:Mu transposase C-terminal domain-containing protein n=1 Tax=Leeia speluncae TaxID=2884804 RepID=A0ABS8D2B8_9NEIS|nr:Mu transposase C-terminal domain-containing protein [Leeia speluncae]MCB6182348.1 Mu transposase C-terminal domain-containing protein [Leeia speluncae]